MSENDVENISVTISNPTGAPKSYSSEYNTQVMVHVHCTIRGTHRLAKIRLQYSSEIPIEIYQVVLDRLNAGQHSNEVA